MCLAVHVARRRQAEKQVWLVHFRDQLRLGALELQVLDYKVITEPLA
jgi:hypothetical protein